MPIYTYRCTNCGVQFDQQQKFSDSPLTRCPECSKKTLQKVFQPVGIVFKGSGFYSTDHRSPSGQGRGGSKSHDNSSHDSSEKPSASDSTASSSEGSSSPAKPASSSSSSSSQD